MKKNYLIIVIVICAFNFQGLFAQMMLKEVSLKKQIENSSLVVEGKVISKQSFWDVANHHIYTKNIVEVYKVFKGDEYNQVEIITKGGSVGSEMEMVTPSLQLQKNATGIFMLKNSNVQMPYAIGNSQFFSAYSDIQGFYKYNISLNKVANVFNSYNGIEDVFYNVVKESTKSNFKEVKQKSFGKKSTTNKTLAVSISSISPTTITAGTKSILTINGGGFGSSPGVVRFTDADYGELNTLYDALSTQIKSWSDAKIEVEVPARAGTGNVEVENSASETSIASQTLTVSYSEINAVSDFLTIGTDYAFQTQLIDDNGSGGYTWRMFTDFNADSQYPGAKAAFMRAFNNWKASTDVNWIIGSTIGTDVSISDGFNVIRFDNGNELEVGNLGVCYFYTQGCGNTGVPSSGRTYISELDIVFDDATNWNFSTGQPAINQYDFESVALHELGHGHQLGHVINTDDAMHYAISNGEDVRLLNLSNIAAGDDIMNRSTNTSVCGYSKMIAGGLSVEEAELKDAISIYPNPANGLFNIKNSSLLSLDKVVIYDIRGRLVSEYDMRNTSRIKTINLVGISKGMYFVNVYSEKAMITKKLILE